MSKQFEELSAKMEANLSKAKAIKERFKNLISANKSTAEKVEEMETENALLLEQTEELSSHLEELDSLFSGLDNEDQEKKPIFNKEEIEGLEDGGATGPAWMRREAERNEEAARLEDSTYFENLSEAEKEERHARGLPISTAEAEAMAAFNKELEETPAEDSEAAPSIKTGLV